MGSFACMLALALASGFGGGDVTSRSLEVTIQDDALMLHASPEAVRGTAHRMAAAGADRVRITAGWSAIAPSARSARRPAFDASDPAGYPAGAFASLDRAVRAASAEGLEPMLDVAFWAPRWAVRRPSGGPKRDRERWAPSAAEYGLFAEALARRYSGAFPDPEDPQRTLPAVRLWTTWNEPNHAGFLLPQWRKTRRGWRAASPHLYRALHEAGYAAIKKASPENQVLLGGLAARGQRGAGERRTMPPLRFTRELACVDILLRPLAIPECADFEPLRADGFAFHPYSLDRPPSVSNPDPDSVPIADLDRLSTLLAALRTEGRLAQDMPLYLTEYGYETNPPDTKNGVAPEDQARFHGHATFLAWRRGDTRMFAQFLLQDLGPDLRYPASSARRFGDWQSGLYFSDGSEKPALQGFKLPFHAEARTVAGRSVVLLFGQVRPGTGQQRAVIEAQSADGTWREVATLGAGVGQSCDGDETSFFTDANGFYLRALPYQGTGTYRPRWLRPDGGVEHGVPVTVAPSRPVAVDARRTR